MRNLRTEIKLDRQANIWDIMQFVQHNENSFEVIKQAILKANSNAEVTEKYVKLNGSTIVISYHYNPYPNIMWNVL